jgi:hypothetical protein
MESTADWREAPSTSRVSRISLDLRSRRADPDHSTWNGT